MRKGAQDVIIGKVKQQALRSVRLIILSVVIVTSLAASSCTTSNSTLSTTPPSKPPTSPPPSPIPSVLGSSIAVATATLQALGLTTSMTKQESAQSPGTVIAQTPAAGSGFLAGEQVNLVVAAPYPRLPNVRSLVLSRAKAVLLKLHVKLHVVWRESSAALGTVIGEAPAPGTLVAPHKLIHLVVAGGVNGNPWGYNFRCCSIITNPSFAICSYFNCIASFWDGRGYVVQCVDGEFSKSGGIQGACSYHSGESRPLYAP